MRPQKGSIKSWLIFIVVIIIVISGLIYLRQMSQVPEGKIIEKEEVKKPSKPFAVDQLGEQEKRDLDESAMNKAILAGTAEECEKITYDEELRQKCLDNINYAKILKSGDEKRCEELFDPELKQACYDKLYYAAAIDSFDTSLCQKISDETLKSNCTNKLQSVMGRKATSESDCNSITDPRSKQECLDNYRLSSGIKTMDEESCDEIEDAELRAQCKGTITQNLKAVAQAKAAQQQPIPETTQELLSTCEDQSCKDEANYNLAFEEKDLTYCNRIADTDKKQECIKEQGENIDQYYYRRAIGTRNISDCDRISNSSLEALCRDSI